MEWRVNTYATMPMKTDCKEERAPDGGPLASRIVTPDAGTVPHTGTEAGA